MALNATPSPITRTTTSNVAHANMSTEATTDLITTTCEARGETHP
jgi:hypothetical protein